MEKWKVFVDDAAGVDSDKCPSLIYAEGSKKAECAYLIDYVPASDNRCAKDVCPFGDEGKEIEQRIDAIIAAYAWISNFPFKGHTAIESENFENLQIALRDYILSLLQQANRRL